MGERCPGCGAEFEPLDGPTHPYIGASAACWARYGELLAREYDRERYDRLIHGLSVDAYAAQHPGERGRRQAQSVRVHLATLCAYFVEGVRDGDALVAAHRKLSERDRLGWLEPPERRGEITVADIDLGLEDSAYARAIEGWARSVWDAWSAHHAEIAALGAPRPGE